MKKNNAFFFLLVSLTGLAFTTLSETRGITPYNSGQKPAELPVDSTACDTISFNAQIVPVFYNNCVKCHEGLSDYNTIMQNAGHILKALKGDGAVQMPEGSDPLHDTLIQQFSCWIAQGKLNN